MEVPRSLHWLFLFKVLRLFLLLFSKVLKSLHWLFVHSTNLTLLCSSLSYLATIFSMHVMKIQIRANHWRRPMIRLFLGICSLIFFWSLTSIFTCFFSAHRFVRTRFCSLQTSPICSPVPTSVCCPSLCFSFFLASHFCPFIYAWFWPHTTSHFAHFVIFLAFAPTWTYFCIFLHHLLIPFLSHDAAFTFSFSFLHFLWLALSSRRRLATVESPPAPHRLGHSLLLLHCICTRLCSNVASFPTMKACE